MKKLWVLLAVVLLAGCQARDYETLSDAYVEQQPQPGELFFLVPADGTVMTCSQPGEELYLWEGCTLSVRRRTAGDLDATLREVTGYGREALSPLQWEENGLDYTACAYVCAGEGGDRLGRTLVLDDGAWHYCLTLLVEADRAEEYSSLWENLKSTASIAP